MGLCVCLFLAKCLKTGEALEVLESVGRMRWQMKVVREGKARLERLPLNRWDM